MTQAPNRPPRLVTGARPGSAPSRPTGGGHRRPFEDDQTYDGRPNVYEDVYDLDRNARTWRAAADESQERQAIQGTFLAREASVSAFARNETTSIGREARDLPPPPDDGATNPAQYADLIAKLAPTCCVLDPLGEKPKKSVERYGAVDVGAPDEAEANLFPPRERDRDRTRGPSRPHPVARDRSLAYLESGESRSPLE